MSRPSTPHHGSSSILTDRKNKNKQVRYTLNRSQYEYITQKEIWQDQSKKISLLNERDLLKAKEMQLWKNYLSQYGVLFRMCFFTFPSTFKIMLFPPFQYFVLCIAARSKSYSAPKKSSKKEKEDGNRFRLSKPLEYAETELHIYSQPYAIAKHADL